MRKEKTPILSGCFAHQLQGEKTGLRSAMADEMDDIVLQDINLGQVSLVNNTYLISEANK